MDLFSFLSIAGNQAKSRGDPKHAWIDAAGADAAPSAAIAFAAPASRGRGIAIQAFRRVREIPAYCGTCVILGRRFRSLG